MHKMKTSFKAKNTIRWRRIDHVGGGLKNRIVGIDYIEQRTQDLTLKLNPSHEEEMGRRVFWKWAIW